MLVMARHRWSSRVMYAKLDSPAGGVARDMLRRGLKVESAAKRNLAGANGAPRRINNSILRNSIGTRLVAYRGHPAARVGTRVWYARLVHDGTGLYGPRKRRITPKTKKVLRFKPKGSAQFIFRPSVAGMKPNPFLKDALPAARD